MNTKASVAYGWGVLILAGGGAYYFAKRSINADREERAATNERRRIAQQRMRMSEFGAPQTPRGNNQSSQIQSTVGKADAGHGDDRGEGVVRGGEGGDPAPVSHAQEEMSKRGKYEAAEPFRSRKGDRFS